MTATRIFQSKKSSSRTRCSKGRKSRSKENSTVSFAGCGHVVNDSTRLAAYLRTQSATFELYQAFAYSPVIFIKVTKLRQGSYSRNDTPVTTCWSDDNISFAVIRAGNYAVDKTYLSAACAHGMDPIVFCFPLRLFFAFSLSLHRLVAEIFRFFARFVNNSKAEWITGNLRIIQLKWNEMFKFVYLRIFQRRVLKSSNFLYSRIFKFFKNIRNSTISSVIAF